MNEAQQNVFVVEVDMENREVEDIAREAALKIVGITDALMEQLARIDFIDEEHGVLTINQLRNNIELTEEILKDGIKIYG